MKISKLNEHFDCDTIIEVALSDYLTEKSECKVMKYFTPRNGSVFPFALELDVLINN